MAGEARSSPLKRTLEAMDRDSKQAAPAKVPKVDYSEAVIVVVGVDGNSKSFHVPTSVLCPKSEFFRAACSNSWKEAVEKKIQLPSCTPAVFQAYLHWMYTGVIDFDLLRAATSSTSHPEDTSEVLYLALVKLHCFADYIQDSTLTVHSLKSMVDVMENKGGKIGDDELPSLLVTKKAYKQTSRGSPLRRLLVNVYVGRYERGYMEQAMPMLPRELVQELTLMSIKDKGVAS